MHQGSAVVLFLLTLIHATIVCFFVRHVKEHHYKRSSILCKEFGLGGMIISLIASVIFHPASNISGSRVSENGEDDSLGSFDIQSGWYCSMDFCSVDDSFLFILYH